MLTSASFAKASDPDQFICSVYDLEKRLKRKAEKEQKKLTSPPWDLSLIERSIDLLGRFLSDLPSFVAAQLCKFPPNYIANFIQRLDRAGWSRRMDPSYTVPLKIIARLAASVAKPSEFEDDCFFLITAMESKMEAVQRREEAERRVIEAQLRRQQELEAGRARKREEKVKKEALNKAAQEVRRIQKVKNQ